jgi:cytochrome c oxidase cbb3-type subunit I/II
MKGLLLCRVGIIPLISSISFALFIAGAHSSERTSSQEMRLYFQGRYVFQKQCIPCHGKTGRGDGEWAKGVTDKPRNFRVGVFKFRTTARGFLPTDEDLRRTIKRGVSGTMMPAFKSMSDSDLNAIISYLKVFSSRWNKSEYKGKSIEIPDVPEWYQMNDKRVAHIDKGRGLFEVNCVICHGKGAKGDGVGSKGLIDIWKNPILPGDLTKEHHKSGDSLKDLYRTVALGLDGTPMLGYLEALGQESIWDLVTYIKSVEESDK